MLNSPASTPKNVLLPPVVLARPANVPKNVLLKPVVLAWPAFAPTKELAVPLRPLGALFVPAPMPAKKLLSGRFAVPLIPSTRLPPILYCVEVLTMLPVKVPPIVPLPEMLKSLDACGDVVF